MRLTYRTVRVLMATAEHPGASNRLIADTPEITDQGQISKLLGRLQRAGSSPQHEHRRCRHGRPERVDAHRQGPPGHRQHSRQHRRRPKHPHGAHER